MLDLPYLIDLQRSSYENFLQEGIKETFQDISPIEDFTGNLVLEFLEHTLEPPTYTVLECRDRDATYARPLKVRVRLITKEGGDKALDEMKAAGVEFVSTEDVLSLEKVA